MNRNEYGLATIAVLILFVLLLIALFPKNAAVFLQSITGG